MPVHKKATDAVEPRRAFCFMAELEQAAVYCSLHCAACRAAAAAGI
jgi:hypothetical protein